MGIFIKNSLILTVFLLLSVSCRAEENDRYDLMIKGARIYSSHMDGPVDGHSILITDGKIAEIIDAAATVSIPARKVIEAGEMIVIPGFWNCHVHFTEPEWLDIESKSDAILQRELIHMLTRFGFTSVVDTGSDPVNTINLRNRIDSGKLAGPHILLATGGFVAENGTPAYLDSPLPEISTPGQATGMTRYLLNLDVDAIKIFTGSFLGPGNVKHMPVLIVRAITDEAHRQRRLVFSHPQDITGVVNAIEGGVDVLAHTAPMTGPWDEDIIKRLIQNNISLIPTLYLNRYVLEQQDLDEQFIQRNENAGVMQLRDFHNAGGLVLFGTDVGYMRYYHPGEEYKLMSRAGMDFQAILRSLTLNPVFRFADKNSSGTVESGKSADLVLLRSDPAEDIRNLADVYMTIREGEIIFLSKD